jgi:Integral membrane protein S linking to the trans Golgi network
MLGSRGRNSGGGRFRGKEKFNPLQHLLKMAAVQFAFWACYCLSLFIGCSLIGYEAKSAVTLLFDASTYSPWTSLGWVQIASVMVGGVGLSLAVMIIVARLRRAVDFAGTAFFFHFIGVLSLYGVPYSWTWWLVQSVVAISSCSLAEFLCLQREMQDIQV